MFVKNCWYVAGWDEELNPGAFLTITIINEPLLIYRTDDDRLVALEDRCCHRFAPLSKGRLEDGCNIRCMYHGLKFDPNGQCIAIPGQDKIPDTAKVRSYPVVGRHSWIWVWMGDVEAADESLIPPAVGYDDGRYGLRHGNIDYQANYQLLNDNLTDFSHLTFVHANSFRSTNYWADLRPHVKPLDRGIRVTRWFGPDQQPMVRAAVEGRRAIADAGVIAMYQTYDYLAPGILLMYTAFHRPEDMPEDRVSRSEGKPVSVRIDNQAVTPMTDTTTRYFFSAGAGANEGGEELKDLLFATAQAAFAEDKDMIEAQQRQIDLKPGREVLTTADVGPVQMRAVMRRLARAERNEAVVDERENAA